MNYTAVLHAIQSATAFDLYRLSVAIHHELANPKRMAQCRNHCAIGDRVHYFDAKTNQQHEGIILEKKSRSVIIESCSDHKRWKIPYYLLNLQNINTNIHGSIQEKCTRNTLKTGDAVGFHHDGKLVIGKILRLNAKTVTFLSRDHLRWRVNYDVLFRFIDGEYEASIKEEYLQLVSGI